MIFIKDKYKSFFGELDSMADFFSLEGKVYKEHHRRSTRKIKRENDFFFIKCHRGVGWGEILKNLIQLKIPILGARTEWKAIHKLQSLGIPAPVAVGYGIEGRNPAAQMSFIITEDIGHSLSLEKLTREWGKKAPDPKIKWKLIKNVAKIAREIHQNGIFHRDFYLCHFLLLQPDGITSVKEGNQQLILIDLHRVQICKSPDTRRTLKDLSGLLFSSLEIGLTKLDYYRFMKTYREATLKEILKNETDFWKKVRKRADKLATKHK